MAEERRVTRRTFLRGIGAAAVLAATPHFPFSRQREVEVPVEGNRRLKVLFHFGLHDTSKRAEEEVLPLIRKFKPHILGFESFIRGGHEDSIAEIEDNYARLPSSPYHDRLIEEAYMRGIKLYGLERNTEIEAAQQRELGTLAGQEYDAALDELERGNLNDAIRHFTEHMLAFTELKYKREHGIKRRLTNLYHELSDRYPEIRRQPEIRVVIPYGIAHTPIYLHAKHSNFESVARTTSTPAYFDPVASYSRKRTFEVSQTKPTENEAARALFMEVLYFCLPKGTNNDYDYNRIALASLISKKLTLPKIKSLLAAYPAKRGRRFVSFLKQNGILIPKDQEELRAVLARRLGSKRVAQ